MTNMYFLKIPVSATVDVIGSEAEVTLSCSYMRGGEKRYSVKVPTDKKDGTYITIEEREQIAIKKAIKLHEKYLACEDR